MKALEVHRDDQKIFRDQFSSAYNIELDLIFAAPNGAPLDLSIGVGAIQTAQNPEIKRREPPPAKTLPRVAPVSRRHGTSRRAERLGHSSVMVTATVYSHRLTGRDQEAANRWEEFHKSTEQPERKQ